MNGSFPKKSRLRKRYQFQRVSQCSKRSVGHLIIIEFRPTQGPETRLGVTVSRRYGKAHERNRFKRIVREAFRLCRMPLPRFRDLIIRPRANAKTAKMQEIQLELMKLLE